MRPSFDPEHNEDAYRSYIQYRSVLSHRLSYLTSRLGLAALATLALAVPSFYIALKQQHHEPPDIAAILAAIFIFSVCLGSYLIPLALELRYVTRLGHKLFDRDLSVIPEYQLKLHYGRRPSAFTSFEIIVEVITRLSFRTRGKDERE